MRACTHIQTDTVEQVETHHTSVTQHFPMGEKPLLHVSIFSSSGLRWHFLGILVFSFLARQCQLPEPGKWKSGGGACPLGSHVHAEWGTDPALSPRASHLAPLMTGGLCVF